MKAPAPYARCKESREILVAGSPPEYNSGQRKRSTKKKRQGKKDGKMNDKL